MKTKKKTSTAIILVLLALLLYFGLKLLAISPNWEQGTWSCTTTDGYEECMFLCNAMTLQYGIEDGCYIGRNLGYELKSKTIASVEPYTIGVAWQPCNGGYGACYGQDGYYKMAIQYQSDYVGDTVVVYLKSVWTKGTTTTTTIPNGNGNGDGIPVMAIVLLGGLGFIIIKGKKWLR